MQENTLKTLKKSQIFAILHCFAHGIIAQTGNKYYCLVVNVVGLIVEVAAAVVVAVIALYSALRKGL